jgi:hypothetical protein
LLLLVGFEFELFWLDGKVEERFESVLFRLDEGDEGGCGGGDKFGVKFVVDDG